MATIEKSISEGLVGLAVNLIFVLALSSLAWHYRSYILEFLNKMNIKSVGVSPEGGITLERFEAQVTHAYIKQELGPPSPNDLERARQIRAHLAPIVAGQRVLWVDDRPFGNEDERALFVGMNIDVQSCRSTSAALVELREARKPYGVVISDWRRPEEDSEANPAGIILLRALRDAGVQIPVAIYHGKVEQQELARRRKLAAQYGAIGTTGSPGELMSFVVPELVKTALNGQPSEQAIAT
jgi:CheY-like chemotaxis protein